MGSAWAFVDASGASCCDLICGSAAAAADEEAAAATEGRMPLASGSEQVLALSSACNGVAILLTSQLLCLGSATEATLATNDGAPPEGDTLRKALERAWRAHEMCALDAGTASTTSAELSVLLRAPAPPAATFGAALVAISADLCEDPLHAMWGGEGVGAQSEAHLRRKLSAHCSLLGFVASTSLAPLLASSPSALANLMELGGRLAAALALRRLHNAMPLSLSTLLVEAIAAAVHALPPVRTLACEPQESFYSSYEQFGRAEGFVRELGALARRDAQQRPRELNDRLELLSRAALEPLYAASHLRDELLNTFLPDVAAQTAVGPPWTTSPMITDGLLELAEATLAADHGDALAETAAELHRMRLRALLELLRPAMLRASREGAHALEELKAFEGARLTAATHLRTLNAHEVLATLAEEFHDTRTLAELCARQRLVPWAVALERRLLSGEAAQAGGDAGGGTSPPLQPPLHAHEHALATPFAEELFERYHLQGPAGWSRESHIIFSHWLFISCFPFVTRHYFLQVSSEYRKNFPRAKFPSRTFCAGTRGSSGSCSPMRPRMASRWKPLSGTRPQRGD